MFIPILATLTIMLSGGDTLSFPNGPEIHTDGISINRVNNPQLGAVAKPIPGSSIWVFFNDNPFNAGNNDWDYNDAYGRVDIGTDVDINGELHYTAWYYGSLSANTNVLLFEGMLGPLSMSNRTGVGVISSDLNNPFDIGMYSVGGNEAFYTGVNEDGLSHAWLYQTEGVSTVTPITPPSEVPEPATSFMIGAGLLAIAGVVRMRGKGRVTG